MIMCDSFHWNWLNLVPVTRFYWASVDTTCWWQNILVTNHVGDKTYFSKWRPLRFLLRNKKSREFCEINALWHCLDCKCWTLAYPPVDCPILCPILLFLNNIPKSKISMKNHELQFLFQISRNKQAWRSQGRYNNMGCPFGQNRQSYSL